MNKTTIIIYICVVIILLLILYIVLIKSISKYSSPVKDKKYPIISSSIKLYKNCNDIVPFNSIHMSLPLNLHKKADYKPIIGNGIDNICCIKIENLEIKVTYEKEGVIKTVESFGNKKFNLDGCPKDYTIIFEPFFTKSSSNM